MLNKSSLIFLYHTLSHHRRLNSSPFDTRKEYIVVRALVYEPEQGEREKKSAASGLHDTVFIAYSHNLCLLYVCWL